MSEKCTTRRNDVSSERTGKKIVEMTSPGLDLLAKVATREYSPSERSAIVDTCPPEHTGLKFEREQEAAKERDGDSITATSVSPTSGEVPFPD